MVEAKLHQTKVLRNDYVDFEDTMAQFEEELLDMEDTFGVIRARVYNFDQIIVNITGEYIIVHILQCSKLKLFFKNAKFYGVKNVNLKIKNIKQLNHPIGGTEAPPSLYSKLSLDLAELEGKLELWRSLFDKGLDGAGCPMIPALMSSIQVTRYKLTSGAKLGQSH